MKLHCEVKTGTPTRTTLCGFDLIAIVNTIHGVQSTKNLSQATCAVCLLAICWLSYQTLWILIDPSQAFAQVALRGAASAPGVDFSQHASTSGVALLRFRFLLIAIAVMAPLLAAGALAKATSSRLLVIGGLLPVMVALFAFVTVAIYSST